MGFLAPISHATCSPRTAFLSVPVSQVPFFATLIRGWRERSRALRHVTIHFPEDADLLAAWRAGDPEAGSLLLSRYVDPLRRFFQSRVTRGSEDLVQQTLLACFEAAHRFRGESSFKAYLMAIARGQWLMYLRGHCRKDSHIGTLEDLDLGDLDLEEADATFMLWEEQGFVTDALRRIPPELREVLELHYWRDLKVHEIALLIEVPEGTIKSRLARGRKLVRAQLERTAEDCVPLRVERAESSCSAM